MAARILAGANRRGQVLIGHRREPARGVYVPTSTAKRIWPGSWISEEALVQICVREPKNILAVWHVRPGGGYGKPGAG
jgi:hypothetical protein